MALNCSSVGGEGEESTVGRAGVTVRPPIVAVRFRVALMVAVGFSVSSL